VTRRLVSAGELLGINVLDSLVVTEGGHVSIREERPETFKATAA
jgi:DNA repair protein RadC